MADLAKSGVLGMAYIYIWRRPGTWEQTGEQELKSAVIDDSWVAPDYRRLGIVGA